MRYEVIKFGVTIGVFDSLNEAELFFEDNKYPYTSLTLYDIYMCEVLKYWSY